MELNSSWKWVVLIELQLSCNELYHIYIVSCNFATHATCPLELMAYKYNELQVSFIIKELNYKASCKTPFFSHSVCKPKTYMAMQLKTWMIIFILKQFYKKKRSIRSGNFFTNKHLLIFNGHGSHVTLEAIE